MSNLSNQKQVVEISGEVKNFSQKCPKGVQMLFSSKNPSKMKEFSIQNPLDINLSTPLLEILHKKI